MKRLCTAAFIAVGFAWPTTLLPAQAPAAGAIVTVTNPIDLARPSETITLPAADLRRLVGVKDVRTVHVRDAAGHDALTQAIDLDDDGQFEELIFQTDLGPRETKRFSLAAGERQVLRREDFKA